MATVADKLTYLNETKTAIKNAIISKGIAIEDTDTFRSYADKIGEISTNDLSEYSNVIALENMMRGTEETEQEAVVQACNDISQFLYGTDNQ